MNMQEYLTKDFPFFADGSVRFLDESIAPHAFRALVTISADPAGMANDD